MIEERLKFVARPLAGEAMADLCRKYGTSRKTGYKIFNRYQKCGIQGLTDSSRRPYRYANQLPFQVENYILNVNREHAIWDAHKIRERLMRRFTGIQIPAQSTIHAGWIGMAWWSAAGECVVVHREPLYPLARRPMNCGAPITKANSYWGIVNTATR